MQCFRCGICCQETEMLLSNEDIERLEREGYCREFFTSLNKEGYVKLSNTSGHCVFYDANNHQCKVYAVRPLGCRLFPVILVEATGIRVDNICPAKVKFEDKTIAERGRKVLKLLDTIDEEAESRVKLQ